jgi:phosphatidylglycerophosphate synthase
MKDSRFGGDKKLKMTTLLAPCERKLVDSNVHHFPGWIEGYHLTLLTIPWSVGVIVFGYLASVQNNLNWLCFSSLMLGLQWFTDCFDGALGRHRDTGIPKWGFYMDHFLDFIFVGSVFVGYSFLFKSPSKEIIYILMLVSTAFMVNSFLSFGASGKFKITYLRVGPTEIRISFIVVNALFIAFGTTWIEKLLPLMLLIMLLFLFIVVFRTQKYVWGIDMEDKRRSSGTQQDDA